MSIELWNEFFWAIIQTLYMTFLSGLIAFIIGLPMGMMLFISKKNTLVGNRFFYGILSVFANITRSIPFIILLIALIPLTRLITGTSIGTTAAIVPLSFAAIPFFARLVESALNDLNSGLIETGLAIGATPFRILVSILLPEAMSAVIKAVTLMLINLLAYSAMAGVVGGGGLGDLAIRYGYHRFNIEVMLFTLLALIIIVQCLQWSGDYIAKFFSNERGSVNV
jgi:D-methionine transport system permease protein